MSAAALGCGPIVLGERLTLRRQAYVRESEPSRSAVCCAAGLKRAARRPRGGASFHVTTGESTGQRAGSCRYDPYGQAALVEGTLVETANPFRWIGGYQNNTDMPGGYTKLGAPDLTRRCVLAQFGS